MYQYTLLCTDGRKIDLGITKKRELSDYYRLLNCRTVEIIPTSYYEGYGKCTMWGDEEARLKGYGRNPFFKVLKDSFADWDIVGDIICEQKVRKEQ